LALLHHHGVNQGRLSLNQWIAICCTNPARLFGLLPRKGRVTVGADADLVIFDPDKEVKLGARQLHQHVDYTPYEGFQVIGYPQHTLVRGRLVVEDGEFVGEPGYGRFLFRQIPEPPPLGGRQGTWL
jgi:dihydropyrimidinase